MFTLTVKSIQKVYSPADNNDVIEVACAIVEPSNEEHADDTEVEVRKLAFPIATEKEALKIELQKFIDNYNLEYKQKLENAEHNRQQAQADETIAEVDGMSFEETKS